MPDIVRYAAAACSIDLPNPRTRADICARTDRMVEMVRMAVEGYSAFLPVKLLVFPEFGHAAPVYLTVKELLEHLTVRIPNDHTERYVALAKEYGVWIQTGSFLEEDPRYPGHVFNTTCLVGPDGILSKYRKVNPWIPWEVHTSPHDIPDYAEPLFPVVDTPIGKLSVATCYDWLFPEVTRQMAADGAEVLIRISAYMDPWGATAPMDWWTTVNRCRALENVAYVVAANQGASLANYPPFSWPGGSMIVDFDGRLVAQADPGPGEKIVVGPVDISALRHEREARLGHHMLAHLRNEAYPVYRKAGYRSPLATGDAALTVEGNQKAIRNAKARFARGS